MKKITLEMSLKAFRQTDTDFIERVCRHVFEQWKPLLQKAETAAILLWTSDGSELLDYRGNLDDSFEWAYWIGGANNREENHRLTDPRGIGLHTTQYLYTEHPPRMTYRILQNIVATMRRVGKEALPKQELLIGTTVDSGPEFARSAFKYERHPELCTGGAMGKNSMICAYNKLHADNISYAGFPNGISEGTPFGTFLGRQSSCFLKDMGFDYIWLSNGLGFGREVWSADGAIFDGTHFHYEKMELVRRQVSEFWQLFRQECPDYPIEVRGTNMSMGIDMASDGVPLKEIYTSVAKLLPPPNSPWAAIDGKFGLELMGYMSRIARVPNHQYLFRYYIHDIWWMNSPWYDRYNRQPHDIYLPMSIGRLNAEGKVEPPTHLNLLSIDNSFGDFPEQCVLEPLPHLISAMKELPDDVAPLVWVYPFDEYSDCNCEQDAMDMYFGDKFIGEAIDGGLPLSMVTSTADFLRQDKEIYHASVIVSPVPKAESAYEKEIFRYIEQGGRVIFYGTVNRAGKVFLRQFGLVAAEPIEGNLPIFVDGKKLGEIHHRSTVSGGAISAKSSSECCFCTVGADGVYAMAVQNGNSIWIRGSLRENDGYASAELMRLAFGKLKHQICFERAEKEPLPVCMIHRYNNAFLFSFYHPSTTVKTKLRFSYGAPILDAYEAVLEKGFAVYHFPKAEHKECRVFVEQEEGIVSCREVPPVSAQMRRRIGVRGLKNATVRFLAERYCRYTVEAVCNSTVDEYFVGDPIDSRYVSIDGLTFLEVKNVTGEVVFSMPFAK